MRKNITQYYLLLACLFVMMNHTIIAQTCLGSLTVPLQGAVSNQPLTISTTNTQNVSCFGGNNGSISISMAGGSPGYNYSWSDNATINSALRTGLAAGTYTVVVSDGHSCTKTQTFTITQPAATVAVTASASQPAICAGQSVSLQASASGGSGTYTFSWNNGAGTGNNVSVAPATTTTYQVTVSDINGCGNISTVTVNVNPLPTLSFVGLASTYCTNAGIINLAASPSGGSFLVNGTSSATFNTATANANNTITYNYTDNNNCSNTITQSVNVNIASVVSLLQNGGITSGTGVNTITQACTGTPITLTANSTGPNVINYQWQKNGIDIAGATNSTYTVSSGWGVYRVRVTNVNACLTNTDTFSLNFRSLPNAQAGTDRTICLGTGTTIGATTNTAYSYSWYPALGLSNPTISNPVANPANTNTYIVVVSQAIANSGGLVCSKSDDVVVSVLNLPNAPSIAVTAPTNMIGSSAPIACQGITVSLNANNTTGATALLWLKNGTTVSTTTNLTAAYNITSTNGVTDIYTAKIKDLNGCISNSSNSISTTINDAPVPTVTPAGTNNVILLCYAGSSSASQLLTVSVPTGSPAATYTWYQSGVTAPVAVNTDQYLATITNTVTSKTFYAAANFVNGCTKNSGSKIVRKNTACKDSDNDFETGNAISVYPNPTTGLVTFNLGTAFAEDLTYEVYNHLGQVVLTGDWNVKQKGNLITIDISKLAQGVYHYQLTDNKNTQFSDKIIKE